MWGSLEQEEGNNLSRIYFRKGKNVEVCDLGLESTGSILMNYLFLNLKTVNFLLTGKAVRGTRRNMSFIMGHWKTPASGGFSDQSLWFPRRGTQDSGFVLMPGTEEIVTTTRCVCNSLSQQEFITSQAQP